MMREGILVAEESPEVLMSRCNTTTLEEAFLKEIRKQNNSSPVKVLALLKGLKKMRFKVQSRMIRLEEQNVLSVDH